MKCQLIENIEDFNAVAEKWDNCLYQSKEENPFLLSDFIRTWWKYYRHGRDLLIFTIYDNGSIIAGIPLCIEKNLLRNSIVHIGGISANLTHFLLIDKKLNVIEKLLDSLEEKNNWDSLIFHRVLFDNSLLAQTEDALSNNGELGYCISDAGFDGMIDLTRGYNFVLDKLSKRLRRYLKSVKKEAVRLGEVKLLRIKGSLEVRKLFEEYIRLSTKSFRMRKDVSAFENKTYSCFFSEILERFDRKNRLDAYKLIAGAHTLGISFGYRFGNGFKWILTTHNQNFHKLRPGHLLLDSLVQAAINQGDSHFDMYYGGELFYKQQWCNKMIPLRRIEIYHRNLVNKSLIWVEKTLRSNSILINTARKTRKIFNRIKYLNSRT